jgi:hypothetical protein
MKRLNPATNKFFKFGDFREDGKRFKGYARKRSKKTGYFYEEWISAEAFELARARNDKSARKFTALNRKKVRETQRKYEQSNRAKRNANAAKYFAGKDQRTPPWLTDFDLLKMKCIYQVAAMYSRESGEPWHVDHVVPLRGKLVSGLHMPNNLQVIRGVDNIKKKNTYVPD